MLKVGRSWVDPNVDITYNQAPRSIALGFARCLRRSGKIRDGNQVQTNASETRESGCHNWARTSRACLLQVLTHDTWLRDRVGNPHRRLAQEVRDRALLDSVLANESVFPPSVPALFSLRFPCSVNARFAFPPPSLADCFILQASHSCSVREWRRFSTWSEEISLEDSPLPRTWKPRTLSRSRSTETPSRESTNMSPIEDCSHRRETASLIAEISMLC